MSLELHQPADPSFGVNAGQQDAQRGLLAALLWPAHGDWPDEAQLEAPDAEDQLLAESAGGRLLGIVLACNLLLLTAALILFWVWLG